MNQSKIKILYIIPSLASGGAEKFILDLINNLNHDIFEIKLLSFNGGGFFEEEFIKSNVDFKILKKRFKFDVYNFYQICREIKNFSPDIVHTQLGGDIYGKIAAKFLRVKIIISTEQNVLDNDNFIIRFFKRITAKFSDRIIVISNSVKQDVICRYGIKEDKVSLIPNGINCDFLNDSDKKIKDAPFVFGSIGRLNEQKNFSLLIDALSFFKDKNFLCLIVGEGELRSKLENKISNLCLSDKVKLLGTKKDVFSFLSSLDFFVLPSKWEGLGIVLLEAGLAKLPVLASATGGILDIIDDKRTGILFENNNLEDLKEKLEYFFDEKNKEVLADLGGNLNKKIKENFDIKIISQKYSDLYLSFLRDDKN